MVSINKPRVIIGLGNPDARFNNTRHNIGFHIVDSLADKFGGHWDKTNSALASSIVINGNQISLLKPQTYMNNSGDVIPQLKKKGITAEDVLVVHDELELPFSKIVLKSGGSAKGHNGLKSIIERFGTDAFNRLRFGIGRPTDKAFVSSYVLERFDNSQEVETSVSQAVDLIEGLYA